MRPRKQILIPVRGRCHVLRASVALFMRKQNHELLLNLDGRVRHGPGKNPLIYGVDLELGVDAGTSKRIS